MSSTSFTSSQSPSSNGGPSIDPIISIESVKWAARRFILVYGDKAPEAALKHVRELDAKGRLRTAEMFAQIQEECARLLKKSEMLRNFTIN